MSQIFVSNITVSDTVVPRTLIQASVFLDHSIRHQLVPKRSPTKLLSVTLFESCWFFCLSCLSPPSARRWSALTNTPPVTPWISSVLPRCELRYFYFSNVSRLRSLNPDILTSIILRGPTMGERAFEFPKKVLGKTFSRIIFSIPANAPPCFLGDTL